MNVPWKDHIESNPNILRGKPHIKGTIIPVSLILGYLAAGYNSDRIIAEFPDITHEQIAACCEAIENYGLAKLIDETDGDEQLSLEEAKDFCRSLKQNIEQN
jgi:uncharacterized protein (DUF433 family)